MQPLFAYNALIWNNTITILTLILVVLFLVRGLYLFAVLGKHLLKGNQGFQYQQQAGTSETLSVSLGWKVFVNADHRNKMNPDRPDKWCNNSALAVL